LAVEGSRFIPQTGSFTVVADLAKSFIGAGAGLERVSRTILDSFAYTIDCCIFKGRRGRPADRTDPRDILCVCRGSFAVMLLPS
jgi:hypothetical protein